MGKTAQWIIDARKAKKQKALQGIVEEADPAKRSRREKALWRSRRSKPKVKKHGRR